ncbi:hypothetical protein AYI68_g5211 [Smittium mucronatum]|uniref:Uncharacterized protein n=1 Tax=Smittium mucronatum TaxID=133383 RepID=A0A1R0GUZ1_9FUNG|nr:hypothetical protein AYI68_g5211 [Smittium mucronatum]
MKLSLLALTVSLILGNGIIYRRSFVDGFYIPEDYGSPNIYGGNNRFGQYYVPIDQNRFYPWNIRQTQSGPKYPQNWNLVQSQSRFGQQYPVEQQHSPPVAEQKHNPKKIGGMNINDEYGTRDNFYVEDENSQE